MRGIVGCVISSIVRICVMGCAMCGIGACKEWYGRVCVV